MNQLMLARDGITFCLAASRGATEVVVVISSKNDVEILDRSTKKNSYLGTQARLPERTTAVRLELPEGSTERIEFYFEPGEMSAAHIKARWARLIFTGRGRPPRTLANSEALVD